MQKLETYLRYFGQFYEQEELKYIKENFHSYVEEEQFLDIINQIATCLNLIPENKNIYKAFLNVIQKYYTLDCNILEVSAGIYPALSRLILQEQQKLNNGTITALDPRIIQTKQSKIKIIKGSLASKSNLANYDLIVGFMPCEATEIIINQAKKYGKPFIIGLCGCIHENYLPFMSYYYQLNQYHEMILNKAQQSCLNDEKIKIDYLPTELNFPYPILSKIKK